MKYILSYQLDATQTVKVGIEADSQEDALEKADQLHATGELWNGGEAILLEDSFKEDGDSVLMWECDASIPDDEPWPAPDESITQMLAKERAVAAARMLVAAYDAAEESGSVDWSDIDDAVEMARSALNLNRT